MIKAIIFDMDGVLIEAKDWHYHALNKALQLFGFEITRHEHLTTYDGLPTSRKLKMLSKEKNLPESLHDFINEMKQAYTMEMVYTQCKPKFTHERALSNLKANGYKLAVASNSIKSTIETMMKYAHLDGYLDATFSCEDVAEAKPHPDIYIRAIKSFGLQPEECLIVEDNENGIKAAQASGAHVLVVKEVSDTNIDNIMQRIEEVNTTNRILA